MRLVLIPILFLSIACFAQEQRSRLIYTLVPEAALNPQESIKESGTVVCAEGAFADFPVLAVDFSQTQTQNMPKNLVLGKSFSVEVNGQKYVALKNDDTDEEVISNPSWRLGNIGKAPKSQPKEHILIQVPGESLSMTMQGLVYEGNGVTAKFDGKLKLKIPFK